MEAGLTTDAQLAAAQLLTAADGGPFVGSGLKPLFSPETDGVTPLADAARRLDVSCGKRRAALPLGSRGLAAAE